MSRSTRLTVALASLSLVLLSGTATAAAQAPSVPAKSVAGDVKTSADVVLEVLSTDARDVTAITVTPDGRVVFAERMGAIKVITREGKTVEAGRIPVNATVCFDCPDQTLEEGGVHGLEVSPRFARNQRLYLYYSVPYSHAVADGRPTEVVWRLSTFVLDDDNALDLGSEKILMTNPAGWTACCHYGGDIDFLPDGTLTLTVGDDTSPRLPDGMNPRDQRPGFDEYNAERTSQNPADRRGKVLRLMPDGSVPDGSRKGIAPNPFVGNDKFDPYVYAMGFRSNYRAANDPQTGAIFVGNVGPDAAADDPNRGPRGYDELETIPPGGGTNHGWPRCIGNNIPYRDYDHLTLRSGDPLSCKGMTPATLWYPYGPSERFPKMGDDGGRTAVAGVVYRYDGKGRYRLPDRYHGKLLFMEWSRDKIWTIPVTAKGTLRPQRMRLVANGAHHPVDAAIGPDGAVYLAEYGSGFYYTPDSRISRLVPKSASKAPASDGAASDTRSAGAPVSLPLGVPLAAAVTAAAVGVRRRRSVVA